jgi:hypothetical protein
MSDPEFDQLVSLVVEVCGEQALDTAMERALGKIECRPVDATLRHLIPPGSLDRAVQIDRSMLRDAMTSEMRLLLRLH